MTFAQNLKHIFITFLRLYFWQALGLLGFHHSKALRCTRYMAEPHAHNATQTPSRAHANRRAAAMQEEKEEDEGGEGCTLPRHLLLEP